MRYYLGFVLFALLMGGLCMALEVHTAAPAAAMFGLFGAAGGADEAKMAA